MLAWVKRVATSFVFVLIGSTFCVIKNFSSDRRWRFTFYLCIFIYGLQFLWQVSRSAGHKDIFRSSIVYFLDINIQYNLKYFFFSLLGCGTQGTAGTVTLIRYSAALVLLYNWQSKYLDIHTVSLRPKHLLRSYGTIVSSNKVANFFNFFFLI